MHPSSVINAYDRALAETRHSASLGGPKTIDEAALKKGFAKLALDRKVIVFCPGDPQRGIGAHLAAGVHLASNRYPYSENDNAIGELNQVITEDIPDLERSIREAFGERWPASTGLFEAVLGDFNQDSLGNAPSYAGRTERAGLVKWSACSSADVTGATNRATTHKARSWTQTQGGKADNKDKTQKDQIFIREFHPAFGWEPRRGFNAEYITLKGYTGKSPLRARARRSLCSDQSAANSVGPACEQCGSHV